MRLLAHELHISRTTVAHAIAQLVAEGFLVAPHGAGTFVAAAAEPMKPNMPERTAWERAFERDRISDHHCGAALCAQRVDRTANVAYVNEAATVAITSLFMPGYN